ncbi:hypothetical protein F5Y09DRAFT_192879 [Xylaria sp. FL1042]|nr:hypothetical protein F5Y09DRAFT_192879 [Xylaria sp. FL1042]
MPTVMYLHSALLLYILTRNGAEKSSRVTAPVQHAWPVPKVHSGATERPSCHSVRQQLSSCCEVSPPPPALFSARWVGIPHGAERT